MRWIILVLLIAASVSGAQIYGIVYDFGLNKAQNAVVEINSTPAQRIVAINGAYEFTVPSGVYKIIAEKNDEFTEEVIEIGEGRFVRDLILLPDLDEDLIEEEEELPPIDETLDIIAPRPTYQWILWLVIFAILGYVVWKVSQAPTRVVEKKIKEVVVSDDLERLIKFIDKHNGRVLQKDLRKGFPYSEAKISLMVDELEAKGIVKRVKKGRGNIIIKK
jgi:uncharacterized membrane protein